MEFGSKRTRIKIFKIKGSIWHNEPELYNTTMVLEKY